jgi:hypothetical protein
LWVFKQCNTFEVIKTITMAEKETKITKAKISDLKFDERNYNTGTPFGESLIEKSFNKHGAGRSILLDKNNQKFAETGGENVIIVETTGKEIVAVKRMDLDLNTKIGREMALADNATAKANITWDVQLLSEDWQTQELKDWGLPDFSIKTETENEEVVYDPTKQWFINIRCDSEEQAQEFYEKFIEEGLDVKIVT